MSFLNFFKKSPKGPSIHVRVWINQVAKEKACVRMASSDPTLIFIAWSTVTSQHFEMVFKRQDITNEVMMAKDVLPSRVRGQNFVFLERHFDSVKEKKFLESMNAKDVLAHVSLNDPLMSSFNSDRILKVMDKMGHNHDECIEHQMVNKSIERAMEKIKNGDLGEGRSRVLMEWMEGIGSRF